MPRHSIQLGQSIVKGRKKEKKKKALQFQITTHNANNKKKTTKKTPQPTLKPSSVKDFHCSSRDLHEETAALTVVLPSSMH